MPVAKHYNKALDKIRHDKVIETLVKRRVDLRNIRTISYFYIPPPLMSSISDCVFVFICGLWVLLLLWGTMSSSTFSVSNQSSTHNILLIDNRVCIPNLRVWALSWKFDDCAHEKKKKKIQTKVANRGLHQFKEHEMLCVIWWQTIQLFSILCSKKPHQFWYFQSWITWSINENFVYCSTPRSKIASSCDSVKS